MKLSRYTLDQSPCVQRQLRLPTCCLTRKCYRNSSPYFPPQPGLIPPSRSVPIEVHQMPRRPTNATPKALADVAHLARTRYQGPTTPI